MRASGVSDVLSMCVSNGGQRELPGQEETRGRQASLVSWVPLVVAIDRLGALCSGNKKSAASRFAYSNSLKRCAQVGVILIVASQFAGVDTSRSREVATIDKNSSHGSAPAELARISSDPGLQSMSV